MQSKSNIENKEDLAQEIKYLRKRLHELEKHLGPAVREKIPEGNLTLLIAKVGRERVAFVHSAIEEIVPMARLTSVPESADWIAGILNFRGKTVAVIDVLARIQRKERRQELSDFIVLTRIEGRIVGLVVQDVIDIKTADAKELQEAPEDLPFAPHLMGTLQIDAHPVLLVSINNLVASSDLPNDTL